MHIGEWTVILIYRKIRKRSLVFARNIAIGTLLAAVLLLVLMSPESIKFLLPKKDIQKVSANDIKVEKTYRLDTNVLVDCFAENARGLFYTVPAADDMYIAVYVPKRFAEYTEGIAYDTWSYLMENSDTLPEDRYKTKGIVYEMDDELYGFMCDSSTEIGLIKEGEAEKTLLRYVFYSVPDEDLLNTDDFIALVFLAAAILFNTVLLIAAASGAAALPVKKYIRAKDISEEIIENELEGGFDAGGITVGGQYTFIQPSFTCRLAKNADICWAYKQVLNTVHKSYGIKTGTTVAYSVIIALKTGKIYTCGCGSAAAADAVVERYKAYKNIFTGYSEELEKLFGNDREEFLRRTAILNAQK